METLQQKFEQYLLDNCKEIFEKRIAYEIEVAKSHLYYNPTIHTIDGRGYVTLQKTFMMLGQKYSKNYEILQCYTNKRRRDVVGQEYHYITVGEEITEMIDEMILEILPAYISSDLDNVCHELEVEPTIGMDIARLAVLVEKEGIIDPHFIAMDKFMDIPGPIGVLMFHDQMHEYFDQWGYY